MTNPKDPWGQRPEDAPTEHLGAPGASAFDQAGETTSYPTTERYEPWGPPPANATKEFPPLESQSWGAYDGGYGAWAGAQDAPQGAGAPPQYVPPGAQPPGVQPPDQQPPKRNTGLWIALAIGVIALIAVGGVVAGLLIGNNDSSTTAGSTTTLSVPTGGPTPTENPRPTRPSPSGVPGLPGIEGLGATMGTISANDAGTLTISTVSGGTVTVRTDASTQVIALSGASVADLPVGDLVMVQGDEEADGAILARIIISTALPGGGR
ncbi:DUF5666 domain-containing protein [Nocardia puris]|uniref:DUF5666 domain-containing protein n=1 Tax=Nocardia puris TaxID=208602 RepID=A0A366DCY1_9NOCA|nr:DUF5666 domain-containing protein [Nocardia puris]RBO87911.1 hypothetical protein DFR74_110166 [Nocardia puris]